MDYEALARRHGGDVAGVDYDALAAKHGGFSETEGGAAVGNPQIQAEGEKAQKFGINQGTKRLLSILGAGAQGAAWGYAAGPMLEGAATAVTPLHPPTGAVLRGMGMAARSAGPLAGAAAGAVSGVAGETAGQVAELAGASTPVREGVTFAAGAIAPELKVAVPIVLAGLRFVRGATSGAVADEVAKKLGKEKLSDYERQYIDQSLANMQKGKPGEDLATIGSSLRLGAEAVRKTGNEQAHKILADSEAAARLEVDNALKGPIADRTKALEYLETLKENAVSDALSRKNIIGVDRDVSNIGEGLRSIAVARQNTQREAASDAFNKSKDEVAKIVASKEKNPVPGMSSFINNTPAYRSLVQSLQSEIVPGKHSPDIASAYQKILSSISNTERDIFGQPKPVSFQQIDDARRALGDAFRGQPAQGYAAIDEKVAKEYYQKLRDVQVQYGGGAVDRMLRNYADSMEGLQVFGSKAGKKLTALDAYDDKQFAVDPSAIPKVFFSSGQQFKNLVDLVGNKDVAVNAARDYAANQVGKYQTAKQVRDWMVRNRDFLNSVPSVHVSVEDYANILGKAEKTAKTLDTGISRLSSEAQKISSTAQSAASKIRTGGELQSSASMKEAEKLADSLFSGKFSDVKQARNLIEIGDIQVWQAAAPILSRSPKSREAVVGAIQQTMAERPIKGSSQYFQEVVRPGPESAGLLSKETADRIYNEMAKIEAMRIPEPEKLGLRKRLLLQGLAGYGSSLQSRSLVDLIPTEQ